MYIVHCTVICTDIMTNLWTWLIVPGGPPLPETINIVSPAYGFSALALVKCSNEEGPGPRHNTKEDPGTSSLVMKGEHEQDVPCDPGSS